ncbi:amino acid adenylation domain-containing protein, partial [Kitasatospora sp. NPDC058170]|uniref:amino acid adenylation domain-containing protein n=1 Tax=Kitasatospora sp. NPDC058170 TaxID=3346364 RepID=UPI0036DF7ABD
TMYVLTPHLHPTPTTVPGEIHIGGTSLARGYLGRPALTAERFIPNPYGPPGSRLYRTGDLARRLPNGTLDFLGRADTQVKIRGYRIELGEIEARLREHPTVSDTVVTAHQSQGEGKSLVAYVVSDTPIDVAVLREHLAADLPDYMVPAAYIAIDHIPLTGNGKVDHRALPAPDASAFATSRYVAPRTPVEERLAAIWSDVLGLPQVSIEDSFFDLGGDSIRAVRLVGALRAAGHDTSVRDVFQHRTVADLAGLLSGQTAGQSLIQAVAPFALISDEDRAALPPGTTDAYPLSQIQTGMLVEMLATTDSAAGLYHNINSFRIPAERPFSLPALRQAVDAVTRRHDILRTSMHLDGYTQPLQLVHETAELPVTVHDWRGLDTTQLDQARRDYTTQEWATGFDLTTAPLLRIAAHLEDDNAWRLTLSHSHAISEGWTLHTLMMETVDRYQQALDGTEPTTGEPLAIRYADYIAAELASLANPDDQAYWQHITTTHTPFHLPTTWADDNTATTERHWLQVPFHDLEDNLRHLALQAKASLKSVLLAAHLKALSTLTPDDTFHTGVVYHGRLEAPDAEHVLGMHLNTIPFPTTRPTGTWRQLVEHVYTQEAEIWTHRRYPLPAIQRDTGTNDRLLPVMFDHQNFHQVNTDTIDTTAGLNGGGNEFALSVIAADGMVNLGTTAAVVSQVNLERLGAIYRQVLEAMATDPDGSARTSRLPAAELTQLLTDWNTTTDHPVDTCVHEAFAQQAARTPDNTAVTFGDTHLTYAQVNERANRLAHHLRTLGAGPDTLVGLSLERTLDLIPTLLGILKSGAAYLPLDPVNPDDRLAHIVHDAAATIVVTQTTLADRITAFYDGPLVVIDDQPTATTIATHPTTDPTPLTHPDNLVYVIYTSGSTGRPKGVTLTHANVLRLFASAQQHYGFGETDVWPLFHSYAFDVSVWEMWGALLHGGRLVVVPAVVTRSPDEFLALLVASRATVLCQTPSAFRSLSALAGEGDPRIDELDLRAVIFAGERLELSELRSWTDRNGCDHPVLVNMYGITETTVHSTFHQVSEEDFGRSDRNPVGVPLADTAMHLLDADGRLVPVGVPGEIHVGGPAVARGYLNRPALTAERFVPDPFGPAGSRLYRSGDQARRLADGTLDFLGRIDTQVKIRGYRIELGEIEARLREHPTVRDAVAIAHQSQGESKSLVAYVVSDTPIDIGVLREHLAADLPDYMVPAAYIAIDRIPLTPNGKLNHRALPAPDASAFATSRYVAPRTPVEERLAAIWSDVLGLPQVSIEDSFFDLGGDSIRAVRLVGALRAAGHDTSVRDVFQHRTITDLAHQLSGQTAGTSLIQAVAPFALISDEDRTALPVGITDAYPLSQIQTGMLVEMLTAGDLHTYHNLTSFRIPAEHAFSLPALRQAVDTVTRRHDILRTSMHLDGYSQPLQLVHDTAEVPLALHDWRGLDAEQLDRARRDYADQEWAAGFDLTTAPLMRIAVHLEEDDAWRLTLSHAHAMTEGWSYHSMLVEIQECYRQILDGAEPTASEPLAVRYADFIAAELESLASPEDQAFWQDIVAGRTPLRMPDSWAERHGSAVDHHRQYVPYHDVEEGLQRLAVRAKASLKSVLLAAHLKVMSSLTADDAFHTGVVYHGRLEAPDAERVLGMHLNSLPFPSVRLNGTWRQLVERVYAQETEIWAHRRYPLPAIQRDLGEGDRLIPVLFEYQNFHQVDEDDVDMDATLNSSPNEFALSAVARGGYINLGTTAAVVSQVNLERLGAMYRQVLEAMAADPDADATAGHLPAAELTRLLTDWNTTTDHPVDTCVHEAFAQQAARTPDNTALTYGDTHLTYAQVNERANRLAHHLRTFGAGPDTLVGLSLERTLDLIPTLLGILKSGAAYLPLDPVNPDDRLAHIVHDAAATIVVTQTTLADRITAFYDGPLVVIDDQPTATTIATHPTTDPTPLTHPDNLVYVIYTSGSTGRPKGVTLTHANVLRHFAATREQLGFSSADVVTQSHSYAFDISVWEMWGALLHGGRLVIVPTGVSRSPQDFLDLLVGERVTVLCQTPTAFRALTALAGDRDPRLQQLGLRLVGFGGEKLETAELRPWTEQLGLDEPTLLNLYGPTETTMHAAYYRLTGEDLDTSGRSVIGLPLHDLRMHLLDKDGRLVPVGVPGEIHVGGPGLARGYLNRPALTAERFIPNPFGPAGSRLYRTGDLARRQPDGTLDYLGRIDTQVKIRGYRIELGEIEARLREHPTVRDAVVTTHQSPSGSTALVAHVVTEAATGAALDAGVLREHLAVDLPDYMVPAAYLAIDRIPLTSNGKLNHRALPAPDASAFATSRYVAPRTPVEERLAAIWSDVLGLPQVSIEDNFFDLGGDSIRAVRLVGALRAAGHELSVRDVFQHRTITDLAHQLSGQTAGTSLIQAVAPFALISDEDRATLPAGVVDAYPLSQVQTGMLVEMLTAATDSGGEKLYHNINSFRIPADRAFSLPALRQAVDAVTRRHDILRTSMHLDGYSQPLQLVHETAELPVTVHDWRGLDATQLQQARRDYTTQEWATGFDLTTAPLLRIAAHLEDDNAWRLTLSHSHAISEGWTLHTLMMETVDRYQQALDGTEPTTGEPLAIRYADYIAAELASLANPDDQAYWQHITTTHTPFHLPTTWADDNTATTERHWLQVPFHDLEDNLRHLALQAKASLKSVLLAAHLKALSTLTPDDTFHTGVVYHGRLEAPDAEHVLGMHLNTIPFPTTRPTGTWRQLVEHVYTQEAEIWTHRRYPLPAIQRDTGTNDRLLPVMFDHQNFHQVNTDTIDTTAGLNGGGNEAALSAVATDGHIELVAGSGALSRAGLERLGAIYRLVLEAMAADPDGSARTSRLPAAELTQLLTDWNTTTDHPVDTCVHEAFAQQAARTPDNTAVTFGDTHLSYAQVNERANRLAHHLRTLGAGPGTLVGVSLERDIDLVPTLLGVLKSGAAYLPLDPTNPADRLAYILADAASPILVTRAKHLTAFADIYAGELVVLDADDDRDAIAARPGTDPETVGTPDDLMYVIYTSGSTGKPKGVLLTHANVRRMFAAVREEMAFTSSDVVTQSHSYAFDFSVWEMWAALLHGGRLVIVPPEVGRSPEDLLDLLVAQQVTVLCQIPSAFRALSAMAGEGDDRIDGLGLRAVVLGGEKLETAELNQWVARTGLDRTALINLYGPTEITVHCTFHRLDAGDFDHPSTSRLGHRLDDLRIHLLDTNLELVPTGVPGEVHVGGPGLARGYLHQPGLTAGRFIPDPFGPAGSRLYRTGDLARRLPDGTLDFLGRADSQVKVRGYRIELGEIEARLREHPAVRDAVVTAPAGEGGERTLVGYVVGHDAAPASGLLREHLGTTLPGYMIPSAFVMLDSLPLISGGKVDYRALPAPDREAFGGSRYVAPRTPVEERLAAIWSEVLGLRQVSVQDSFFDLGGDSLRAVRLVGAMRAVGFDVSIPDVFRHRTIAGLGAGLAGQAADESLISAVAPFSLISDEDRAALPADLVDAYPLSQIQTGMLAETMAAGPEGRAVYHNLNSFLIRDEQPLSPAALQEAVDTVARRHDILRTSMHLSDYSQPLQLVHAVAAYQVNVHDLRGLDPQDQDRLRREFVAEQHAVVFDLSTAPLLHVSALIDGDDAWRLNFTYHHAISEGWSYNALMMEIVECYQHLRDGRELPEYQAPSVRYADFIAAELESLASPEDRAFWQDVVDGHAPLRLPADWSQTGAPAGVRHGRQVPFADLEDALRALALKANTSLKSVLLAAHLKVMSSLTADDAFHTGVVFHGRLEAPGADRVLGMHLNTLPFPAHRPTGTWRQLVEHVYAQEAEIWTHRRYPLPAVQREAGNSRHLLSVLFEYLDFHHVDTEKVDVTEGLNDGINEFALNVIPTRGKVNLGTTTAVLSAVALERLGAMYRQVLEAMAADPDGDATTAHLPAGTLAPLHGHQTDWPGTSPLHLFQTHAATTPHATAVICGDEQLTYQELDERSNQLAHHLTSLGVTPGDHIGISLDRSPAVLTAMLATWKTGAAYIPVDPALPAERRHYMLTDATATVLITDQDTDNQDTAFTGQRVHPDHAQHHPTTPLHTPHDGDA